MIERPITLRLSHAEAKWLETALASKLAVHEDGVQYGEEMGHPAYVKQQRLAVDIMRDLIAHVNAAVHRAACRHE